MKIINFHRPRLKLFWCEKNGLSVNRFIDMLKVYETDGHGVKGKNIKPSTPL